MKTRRIFVFLGLIFALVIYGCKQPQIVTQTVESKKEAPLVEEGNKAAPWIRDIDESLTTTDPINFYNQHKIIVQGTIPIKVKLYQDGQLVYRDSSIVFDFSVPKMTKGEIIKVDRKSGQIVSITVRLDVEEQNYDHVFYVQPDKTFALGSEIQIILNDKSYPVGIVIDGDGSKLCRLMHYPLFEKEESAIEKEAAGVPDKAGTKVIKQK